MNKIAKLLIGGAALAGLAVASVKTYIAKKQEEESEIIDIEPEVIEDTRN